MSLSQCVMVGTLLLIIEVVGWVIGCGLWVMGWIKDCGVLRLKEV